MANPYGWDHQQLREQLLPLAYGTLCWRCGEVMHEWQDLDLGHDDDDPTKRTYKGIEHRHCNRQAGAHKGLAMRGLRSWSQKPRRAHGDVSVDPGDL